MEKKLRVLIVAAAVHPDKGSEPGLGWGWVQALAQLHDVHVITGEKEGNRRAIELRLEQDPKYFKSLKFTFIDRENRPGFLNQFTPIYYYRYNQWHKRAYLEAKRLCDSEQFDLVHQLNMTGYREPGYLWKLGKPFVWGPVGGTANVPLRFFRELGVAGTIYQVLKVIVNNIQLVTSPRVRAALKQTDGLVASSSETQKVFRKKLRVESIVINDSGPPINTNDKNNTCNKTQNHEFQIAWSGLHISRKALPVALKALAKLETTKPWKLKILGAGPQTNNWKKLTRKLSLEEKCTWLGWVSKSESEETIRDSRLLLMPSLHEGTPAVLFEALTTGTPVVCFDLCGQADVIDETCGIKIGMDSRDNMINNMAKAIDRLIDDHDLWLQLSHGATLKVKDFEWDKKARQMSKVYMAAMAARSE